MNKNQNDNSLRDTRICAALVTYNRLELLKGAISSLQQQEYPCDILIVNNGSTDGTCEYLKNLDGVVIINQDNVGGAGGFYTALKYITEKEYEFAWVMDDDVIANNDCLSMLIEAYDRLYNKGCDVGFVCSKVESPEGISVNMPIIDNRVNTKGYTSWNEYLSEGLIKVQAATFVSVLIPTKNIRSVGLPIREFFIWGDDTEYTLRLSKQKDCYQVGASRIKHLRYGTSLSIYTLNDRRRIDMWRYFVRNWMYISKQGYYGVDSFIYRCFSNLFTISKLMITLKFRKAKSCIIGFVNGLFFSPKIEYPS